MYKKAVHILTMKLFADLERRRKQLESKASEEAAKKRELELAAEEKKNNEKEFAKNWEESRQGRVNSWLNFTCGNDIRVQRGRGGVTPLSLWTPTLDPSLRKLLYPPPLSHILFSKSPREPLHPPLPL